MTSRALVIKRARDITRRHHLYTRHTHIDGKGRRDNRVSLSYWQKCCLVRALFYILPKFLGWWMGIDFDSTRSWFVMAVLLFYICVLWRRVDNANPKESFSIRSLLETGWTGFNRGSTTLSRNITTRNNNGLLFLCFARQVLKPEVQLQYTTLISSKEVKGYNNIYV